VPEETYPRFREMLFLFAIGAAGGLIGDAGNVQSGVTHYFEDTPFWNSALWFPFLVGFGTMAVGFLRLELGPVRNEFDARIGIGAFASVIAIYAVGSSYFATENDSIAKVTLCASLAVLLACFLADRPGLLCGLGAALAGPAVEVFIVHQDWSSYGLNDDGLFGVALWLPPLYFAFGVAVARITELMVARRGSPGKRPS
jgi:hypothetical protein